MTLIKLIVARFVGTKGSIIIYSNAQTLEHNQLKKFRDYFFSKHYSFN
jgi:hypothetical protein